MDLVRNARDQHPRELDQARLEFRAELGAFRDGAAVLGDRGDLVIPALGEHLEE
jgi:hypothetical protein